MRKKDYFEAYLDDMQSVTIYLSLLSYKGVSDYFYLEDEDHNQIPLIIKDDIILNGYHKYECVFDEDIIFGKQYFVFHEYARKTSLIFSNVVKSETFDEMFFYNQQDLGSTYKKSATTFKLWAPTAYKVYIEIMKDNTCSMIMMQRKDKGVYEITINEDLEDASYLYYIEVNGEVHSSLDPYGKACTENSKRSVVVDTTKICLKEYPLPKMESNCDAIIYEASIRDFTTRGTIESFVKGNQSALSYIKNLGVTHLQFLPLLDFASVDDLDIPKYYNWGYDANQWMCFEKSYCRDVHDPKASLLDMASLVNACHEQGIRVNMDVVFNHVYDLKDSSLQKCVPYYYFQYNVENEYSNATMCGNDIDSTRKMCRKIIVDSCLYLAETFGVDGLRFDLMGILDVDTINEIVKKCKMINPSFMVYGEGWNMPSYLDENKRAAQNNAAQMLEVAHFSDRFRDTVKGSTSIDQISDLGYLLSDTSKIYKTMNVLGASTQNIGDNQLYVNADQVINYVECHDNMTSWDKINLAMHVNQTTKKSYHQLLMASVILAQGVPFLHGGQEFARTKQGIANTYNVSDAINKIDWRLANKNQNMIQYVKELIEIRKQYSCLRMHQGEKVQKNVVYEAIQESVLAYYVHDENDELAIYFNPTNINYKITPKSEYAMIFYNQKIKEEKCEMFEINPQSVVILHKKKPI